MVLAGQVGFSWERRVQDGPDGEAYQQSVPHIGVSKAWDALHTERHLKTYTSTPLYHCVKHY